MMKRPCVFALSILPSCYGLVAGNRSESRRRRQDSGLCVKTGTRIRNGIFLWRHTTQGEIGLEDRRMASSQLQLVLGSSHPEVAGR